MEARSSSFRCDCSSSEESLALADFSLPSSRSRLPRTKCRGRIPDSQINHMRTCLHTHHGCSDRRGRLSATALWFGRVGLELRVSLVAIELPDRPLPLTPKRAVVEVAVPEDLHFFHSCIDGSLLQGTRLGCLFVEFSRKFA